MEEIGAELCRRCGGETKVVDIRYNSRGVKWRIRKCKACGYRYHTTEVYIGDVKERSADDEKA